MFKAMLRSLRSLVLYPIAIGICRTDLAKSYRLTVLSSLLGGRRQPTALANMVASYWFRHIYLAESNPDKRETLKDVSMGGDLGKRWAMDIDSHHAPIDFDGRMGNLSYAEAMPFLPEIHCILEASTVHQLVVQIGTSTGREIAWLAARHPRHRFLGTDITVDIVSYAAGKHDLPNLEFQVCAADGVGSLLAGREDTEIIVFSSGALQFVQPEHLQAYFSTLGQRRGLQVLLLEYANEAAGDPMQLKGSVWRGNYSYTHDFRHYAEWAGFVSRACRIIRPFDPYDDPLQTTVHYYYWGQSSGRLSA